MPLKSCRTASPARALPAIRLTCLFHPVSVKSAGSISTAPTSSSHMAHAPPSAPSTPSRKRSIFSRRYQTSRARRSTRCPDRRGKTRRLRASAVEFESGGLDIFSQRFLFHLVFPDAPLDDVADGNQADNLAVLDHRQVPEFAQCHHFHDRTDGGGLLAADDLARHHRTDRFLEHRSSAFAERAMSRSDRMPSIWPLLITSRAPIFRSPRILIAADSFSSGSTHWM